MSQTLEAPQPLREGPLDEPVPDHIEREIQQFSYRPMPLLAIIGMVLGVLSVSSFLGVVGLFLAVLGIVASLAATLKISFDRTAYSGLPIAVTGLTLSTLFFAGGLYNQIDMYRREVPEGFRRISFLRDISEKGYVVENSVPRVHEDVAALVGEPIFLKAWMFPTDEKRNLIQFLVVKDNGLCCFGKQPDPVDSIIVELDPELFPEGVDYTSGMVSLAGTLEVHPNIAYQLYNGVTFYRLNVVHFEHSWTMF